MNLYYQWNDIQKQYQIIYQDENSTTLTQDGVVLKDLYVNSRRGDIGTSWWSRMLVNEIEPYVSDSLRSKARSLARQESIQHLQINPGLVIGRVAEYVYYTFDPRYAIVPVIFIDPLEDDEWDIIIQLLRENPLYLAQMLAGDITADFHKALVENDIWLPPGDLVEVSLSCTCQSRWTQPCAHTLAATYVLAERLDQDPTLLFYLRGRSLEWIVQTLLPEPPTTAENLPKAEPSPDFWSVPSTLPILPAPYPSFFLSQIQKLPPKIAKELAHVYQHTNREAKKQWETFS